MNKKIFFLTSLIAGLSLTACDEDYTDWAQPQSSQEGDMDNIEATVAGDGVSVEMADVASDDECFTLASLTNVSGDLADARFVGASLEGQALPITLSEDGRTASVRKLDLDSLTQVVFNSRSSEHRDLNVELQYYVKRANGAAYGKTASVTVPFNAIPTPTEDEAGYFMLVAVEGNDWNLATPIWMESMGDGIYKATVETESDGNNKYMFYEGSYYSDSDLDQVNKGQMGCRVDGDNAMSNFVVWTGDRYEVQTPVISGAGKWEITLDMRNMTYTVVAQSDYAYCPGDANGWAFEDPLLGDGNGLFKGFAVLGGTWGWKVTLGQGWDNQYGSAGEEGKLAQNGGNIMEGSTPAPYWVEVNIPELTYSLTPVETMSLIGSITDASWGIDTDMTWDAETKSWSVTADLAAGEFKIRMNHDWSISLGYTADHTFDSLTTSDGANMTIEADGNYTITLYPSCDGMSRCTVVKN